MAKSTAKAEALARDLKERLERRGFSAAESKDAQGWPKLTLNTNEASIRIEAEDMISKDIFGNDNVAFAPHRLDYASRDDAMDTLKNAQILTEVVKMGVSKLVVKTDATDLATAEAAAGDAVEFDDRWPTKGV